MILLLTTGRYMITSYSIMHNVLSKVYSWHCVLQVILTKIHSFMQRFKLPTPEQNSTTGRITPKTNIPVHTSHLLSAAMSRKGIYFFERGEGGGS